MSVGVCGDCGRAVTLRGRARICSNCDAIRNSAACGECGEHRRVAARTPDGRPWCERCRKQTRRRDAETDRRRLIIEVVTAACAGSLSEQEIRTVLDRHGHQPAIAAATRRPPGPPPRHVRDRADQRAAHPAPLHPRPGRGRRRQHHHHPPGLLRLRTAPTLPRPHRGGRRPVRGLLEPDPQTGLLGVPAPPPGLHPRRARTPALRTVPAPGPPPRTTRPAQPGDHPAPCPTMPDRSPATR